MASTDDASLSPEHSTIGITMADEIKKDQGFHECEVSASSDPKQAEADMKKHLMICPKNPGHKDFISADEFNIEHIPSRYRDSNMLDLIRAMKYLTFHISVGYTSEKRPENYSFYNHRGEKFVRTGTGMVCGVKSCVEDEEKRKHGMLGKTCPCTECEASQTPKTKWYKVRTQTAQHVVFDDVEAKHTTCRLFYDSEEDNSTIRDFKGETTRTSENIKHDMCIMYCYIHDLELGEKLVQTCKDFKNLRQKLFDKFNDSELEHPLTVIVSHPHGCSKQVTIGELNRREMEGKDLISYIYTTPTCPGCSGAPICVAGPRRYRFYFHPHSQRCQEDGLNRSVVC